MNPTALSDVPNSFFSVSYSFMGGHVIQYHDANNPNYEPNSPNYRLGRYKRSDKTLARAIKADTAILRRMLFRSMWMVSGK